MALTDEQRAAVDSGLVKVGETIGKIATGLFGFIEGLAEKMSPMVMELAVNVLSRMAEAYATKVMRKNGVDI